MKAAAIALAVGTLLTVEQRDAHRSNFDHPSAAVSADGRFVAFTSYLSLVPADRNRSNDVYVLDRVRQHITLESAVPTDSQEHCSHPGISRDGRYIVFERGNVVMLRDRKDDVTRTIGAGSQPAITEDGRRVLFAAGSFDAVTDEDVNGDNHDIYALDLQSGQPHRVSVDLSGLDPRVATSDNPSASSDGRYVAFVSRVQPAGSRAQPAQVFVRDTVLNVTKQVAAGWDPALSANGRFVAFVGLSGRRAHIFLRDLQSGTTRLITRSVRRGLANGESARPKVSFDGRFVAFQSDASDLSAADDVNLLWDVFVYDSATDATSRVSGDADEEWMEPSGGPSIDGSGSIVAFSSRHPTDALDKSNDFDLYVAAVSSLNTEARSHGVPRTSLLEKETP
jgi:TolB protein